MTEDQLRLIEQLAVDAATQAADFVSSRFGGKLDVSHKPLDNDTLVTDVDLASQKLITDLVTARFPDHRVLGEEDKRVEIEPAATDFVWAVDPIDGTTNFVNGLPVYAVSIGVLYRGRPVAAACALPWAGMTRPIVVHAHAGGGAWCGERKLQIVASAPPADGRSPLDGRIAAIPGGLRRGYRLSKDYMKSVGEPRTTGSAVYEQILVAMGVAQYSITGPARIWDFAAGVLIVKEAAGVAMTPVRAADGRRSDHWQPLETFVDRYELTSDTFKRMRAWYGPVLLGPPEVVEFVARNARPRRPSRLRRLRRKLFGRTRRRPAASGTTSAAAGAKPARQA